MSVCLSVHRRNHIAKLHQHQTRQHRGAPVTARSRHIPHKKASCQIQQQRHAINKALQSQQHSRQRNKTLSFDCTHVRRPHIDYSCEWTCREIESTKSLLALELMRSDDCSLHSAVLLAMILLSRRRVARCHSRSPLSSLHGPYISSDGNS